jgi:inosine-uridine nucleoside N-ribohydrolase
LIESADKYGDDLVVICLGALTNIACAMIKSEVFEEKVG